jgi:hypothetical protein
MTKYSISHAEEPKLIGNQHTSLLIHQLYKILSFFRKKVFAKRPFGCVDIRLACHVVSFNHFFYTLLLLKKKRLLGGRLVV